MKRCKPTNSYRFQLSETFGFYDLTKILPFLNKMGIDLVYTSPYFQTPKHSKNPYEITSSEHIDHKYGASKGFEVFLKKIQSLNMGHMMDVVANHMASSPENLWFYDVLKKGRQSQYFSFFAFRFLDDQERVILPYLNKSLKESISEGSVFIEKKSSTLIVNTKRLPVKRGSEKLSLEQLVVEQHYKLIDYHNANKLVNFRRFFDIHELIGLNMHLPKVFKAYHQKIVQWFKKGYIQGFRVDHPDGLHDPSSYFHLLKKSCPNAYIVAEKILQPVERMPKIGKLMEVLAMTI